ncbi:helicase-associated domain-containing protein [Actinomadura sp. HBU206391]|uniref:helicase-associated domain-containing protein n=1 Tax=Actinomadura sp. HBU206391 TaxID=2731692 RepID=UPI0016507223|nr:helicase-associated domain-containing protein [Actinomadura sp. HBU206391]MBC6460294.1 helicase-associated domain-containing protein [Actinomadura sp. HBU206391]
MDSYADWLRARGDEDLRTMLALRPELITPVPSDLGSLAARAAAAASISRALDRLDRFTLNVLEALLVLAQPVPQEVLTGTLVGDARRDGPADVSEPDVHAAVDRLLAHGLVWGDREALRTAPGVRQALPHPAGLGPTAREVFAGCSADRLRALFDALRLSTATAFADPSELTAVLADRLSAPDDLIEAAGPPARAALNELAWGPPIGRVDNARRTVRIDTANSPIEQLLARGLLAATDDRTVTLPREVALHLRQGRLFQDLTTEPPPLDGPVRDPALIDRTAGGQAFTVVRLVEDLLERWGVDPPAVLRTGGLGVRDLRATAALLDVEQWTAALLLETAYTAGLLARTGDADGEWLPTKAYDVWRMRDTAARWSELVTGWLDSDRVPGLAGERDNRDKTINALADESVRAIASHTRRAVLVALGSTAAAPNADAVREHLAWREPRRGRWLRDRLVGWTLREAEVLGLTGLGALSSHARAVLSGRDANAELTKVLPEPVDHVLVQADLTAIAPGPLVTELSRELALMADVESTGGATVFRFTPESVRRALDAGRTAAELADLLTRHSATPVPQPLTYLIEDVARRHGHLRVGIASCYVRTDDPSTLDELMADRRAVALRLHRLAPTVVASRLQRPELLEALRGLGLAPVAESSEGGVVVTRPDTHRAEPSARSFPEAATEGSRLSLDPSILTAAVRALRAGEEAARMTVPDGEPPRTPSMATIDELRGAVERGARVWIGYLDQQGRASSRIVEPARVEGGFLTAYDATRASIQRFALHRITGIAEVDDPTPSPP